MAGEAAQAVSQERPSGKMAVLRAFFQEIASIRRQKWGNIWGYVFVGPAFVIYMVFQAWPIIRGLFMAFSDYRWLLRDTHGLAGFNGLDNWRMLITDQTFWHSLSVAVRFTLQFLPITLFLALFVAIMISMVKNEFWSSVYRVIAYLPVVLPVSVAMLVWAKIYDPRFGYLNVLLQNLGVEHPPNWLGSSRWALIAMTLPTIWHRFGYWMLLFLIGIYNINTEVYEAAVVDGANLWHQIRYITIPLLKPIFTLVFVLGSGILSATVESMALFQGTTSGGPAESCLTTGVYIYRVAFVHGDMRMGYAASMSLFISFINMIITFIVFRTMRTERA